MKVRYSSYGVPYGLPAGDTDSDGDVDSADVSAITGAYDVRKDANLDGTIDVFDVLHASNMAGGGGTVTTGRDVLGSLANANRFGYGAYLRDPAVPQWHVRHRVFRSDIGRWLTRDPAGYVDGLSLYEYARSWAVLGIDPDGQQMLPIEPDGGGGGFRPERHGPYPTMPRYPRPTPRPTDPDTYYPLGPALDIARSFIEGGHDGAICVCEGFIEGVTLSLIDPEFDHLLIDPETPGLGYSNICGEVAGYCIAGRIGCRASKLRVERGQFKFPRKTGPLKTRWHFHIGPEELQRYHLPYEWNAWSKNAWNILKRRWRKYREWEYVF